MALKDITITGSIGSIPTQSYDQKTYISSTDEQSFPLETIIGGAGGSTPDLYGNVSSSNLIVNITQSWSGSINTPVGIVTFVDQTQNEFINGQYSGSNILVTDGELSEDNPFLNVSTVLTNYTPVYYYDIPNSISPNNRNDIPLNNFLDTNTSPDPGEIYIGAGVSSIAGAFLTWQTYAIKIATTDNNGNYNTVALQALESFSIIFSNGTSLLCDVTSIVDYTSQGYVMYWVKPSTKTLRAHELDGKVLDYTVSASNSSSINMLGDNYNTGFFTTITTNPLNYLNNNGLYTPLNTPNTVLYFTASFTSSVVSVTGVGIYEYPSLITITSSNFAANYITFSGSFTPVENKNYILIFTNNDLSPRSITNLQFLITQSQNVDTGSSDLTVLSPYFTQNFFYNDWNSLYGNADGLELDNNFMKVNYETGQSIPTNQQQILTGSAERAPVKPYNYALKAQILPRYEGVRSTSPNFNQNSTEGGYGTLPNVESLKTVIAYCDYIGSWIPDHMEASAAHIKYLLNPDGTVVVPNISQYSLYINQDAFISGEKITISSGDNGSIQNPYRNILRGATRIEPILYTQTGFNPTTFTSSINLFDNFAQGITTDVTRKSLMRLNIPQPLGYTDITKIIPANSVETIGLDSFSFGTQGFNTYYDPAQTSTSSISNPGSISYNVISSTINEATDLKVKAFFTIYNPWTIPTNCVIDLNVSDSTFTNTITIISKTTTVLPYQFAVLDFEEYLLSGVNFQLGSIINFQIINNGNTAPQELWLTKDSYFDVYQNPLPNPLPPITGSIWEFPTSASWNEQSSSDAGIIYIPNSASLLNVYYNVPGVRQKDITSSGFNPITLDWSVKIGDEFRYIGRENKVFTVKKVFAPNDQSLERISATGSLEVHFTTLIPTGSFNINEFLIRRYVDDPSLILFEGFKPPNSSGPYLVKPEFIATELNNNIDKILLDLTQKGLI